MLKHYVLEYSKQVDTLTERLMFAWKYPRSLIWSKKLIKRSDEFTSELINDIANKTEGFSGRELNKLVVAWHDAAFATPEAVLTPELMYKELEKFLLQHKLKSN